MLIITLKETKEVIKKKKKTNIKTIIRQIVREEVAMAIQEVITELKQPAQSKSQPQNIVEKKSSPIQVLRRLLIILSIHILNWLY